MPWGNIQLRAQGTAMSLYWLLLRPRTTLEEQAGVEKAGRQGTRSMNGRRHWELEGGGLTINFLEGHLWLLFEKEPLQEKWKDPRSDGTPQVLKACELNKGGPGKHSPGRWWPQFHSSSCHDCSLPNPMTCLRYASSLGFSFLICEMGLQAVSLGHRQHL